METRALPSNVRRLLHEGAGVDEEKWLGSATCSPAASRSPSWPPHRAPTLGELLHVGGDGEGGGEGPVSKLNLPEFT